MEVWLIWGVSHWALSVWMVLNDVVVANVRIVIIFIK